MEFLENVDRLFNTSQQPRIIMKKEVSIYLNETCGSLLAKHKINCYNKRRKLFISLLYLKVMTGMRYWMIEYVSQMVRIIVTAKKKVNLLMIGLNCPRDTGKKKKQWVKIFGIKHTSFSIQ